MWRLVLVAVTGCTFSRAGVPGVDVDADPMNANDASGARDASAVSDSNIGGDGSVAQIQVTFGERPGADHTSVTRDTYVDSLFPNVLHGGSTEALLDGSPASIMLLRFDLGPLASTVTVIEAELRVRTANLQNNPGFTVVETTSAWSDDELWPGPTQGSTSFGGPASADQDVEYTVPLPAALVQRWIDTPTSNNGVSLTTDTTNDIFIRTSENSNATGRPLLTITLVP
jgi:hypothetical protein